MPEFLSLIFLNVIINYPLGCLIIFFISVFCVSLGHFCVLLGLTTDAYLASLIIMNIFIITFGFYFMYVNTNPIYKRKITIFNLEKAAYNGQAEAQYSLGTIYLKGDGVPKDYNKAVEWYQKAALKGLLEAQCDLGLMYYRGDEIPLDVRKAFEWLRKAALQGDSKSQSIVGDMYASGVGDIQQNYILAYAYYSISNLSTAQNSSDSVRKEMTPPQIERANEIKQELIKEIEENKRKLGRY